MADVSARLQPLAPKADFPILAQSIHGQPLAYLDNAATTQKPIAVLDAIEHFYRHDNANVHRGLYELSRRATEVYEGARATVAAWIGARDPAEVIWTRGTTEALNLVAHAWGLDQLRPGDELLLSEMEHHSNLVPWQLLARRTGAVLRFLRIAEDGTLDLGALDTLISERTRLVAVAHVSNALGTVHPVRRIADAAHAVGALVVVDGAQGAPHLPVDVSALGADFYALSGHKMLGPTGIGALWGRRELLQAMAPYQGGGDMIETVELEGSTWAALPNKFEAGTPHVAGAVGLAAAIRYLDALGRDAILAHERELLAYALDALSTVPGIRTFGPPELERRSGVVSFQMEGVHPHDVATVLDTRGVAIRAGHHCAQPLMRHLGVPATNRASFYVYNSPADVDRLVEGLGEARRIFG
ncbi:MAG: cysteine desulfurase [Gemmatimonadota bacterium]